MTNDVSAEDYFKVMSLYAKFYQATDMGDPDEIYASCFTDDEKYVVDGKVHRDGLAEQLARRRWPMPGAPRRHCVTSILMGKLDDVTIEARAHLVTVDVVKGKPRISTVGNYRDIVRFDAGAWRFAFRELTTDFIDHGDELY